MKIFDTIDDIKTKAAVSMGSNMKTILPYLEAAEILFLKPVIGQEYYDELIAELAAAEDFDHLTEATQAVLPKIRGIVGNLAYYIGLPILNLRISENGVQIVSSNEYKTAWGWQFEDCRNTLHMLGNVAVDDLLEYMEAHKDAYETWATSSTYALGKEFFINTTKDFQYLYNINQSRLIFMKLTQVMRVVEDTTVKAVVGQAYFDSLKAEILASDISSDNIPVLALLRKAVAHLTIAKGLVGGFVIEVTSTGIQITGRAANQNSNDENRKVDDNLLAMIRDMAERDGNLYLEELKDFLNANASAQLYADYFTSGLYVNAEDEVTSMRTINKKDRSFYYGG